MSSTGQKILEFLKEIPRGKVCTYGQLAKKFGTSPRAIGSIMRSNPEPVIVPCHRVVSSDGALRGYSRGIALKESLLREEGVEVVAERIDLEKYGWSF